jgi:hypothetical protein
MKAIRGPLLQWQPHYDITHKDNQDQDQIGSSSSSSECTMIRTKGNILSEEKETHIFKHRDPNGLHRIEASLLEGTQLSLTHIIMNKKNKIITEHAMIHALVRRPRCLPALSQGVEQLLIATARLPRCFLGYPLPSPYSLVARWTLLRSPSLAPPMHLGHLRELHRRK